MLHIELQEEEEFQEADILWPDDAAQLELPQAYYPHDGDTDDDDDGNEYSSQHGPPMELQILQEASTPIDIPGRRKVGGATGEQGTRRSMAGFSKCGASHAAGGFGGGSVIIGSHVFVPPHVIIDRRAKRGKAKMMIVVPSGRARARKTRKLD